MNLSLCREIMIAVYIEVHSIEHHGMSSSIPTLTTDRLILRPFQLSDAKRVQALAGHPSVAATTATIPHPYPDGAAEAWIEKHAESFEKGVAVQFAIGLKESTELIGCIDLFGVSEKHRKAEMGYWIGVDYWNKGYCSEAAIALVRFGFEHFKLNKVTSRHMSSNPASGRVMLKAGLKKEGVLRQEFEKNGGLVDIEVYGILREEWCG
jgi:RimJ/RimL family protein N-acetyltransferase